MPKRILVMVFMFVVIFTVLSDSPAQAHRMLIEPEEEGLVKVFFDDGSPARHAEVTVYDENDEVIARGDVDGEGIFSYTSEDAAYIIAEDGFGHRAEYEIGEEHHEEVPRAVTIILVLLGFSVIAGVFHYRFKRSQG